MKYLNFSSILLIVTLLAGCGAHQSYGTSQFRNRDINTDKIALDKNGLSLEQIRMISSTKPPHAFPVDVAIIVMVDGYLNSEIEHIFTYEMIKELKNYKKIERITVIPKFLLPGQLGFSAIQELGVRSLSEYTLVLHINSSEIFNWTKIFESQFEAHSSIDYILVDSFTSAMLTSDKLFSKQIYNTNILETNETRKAQKQLFSEQGKLLANKIEALFSGEVN